jgi:hypothetical protein
MCVAAATALVAALATGSAVAQTAVSPPAGPARTIVVGPGETLVLRPGESATITVTPSGEVRTSYGAPAPAYEDPVARTLAGRSAGGPADPLRQDDEELRHFVNELDYPPGH